MNHRLMSRVVMACLALSGMVVGVGCDDDAPFGFSNSAFSLGQNGASREVLHDPCSDLPDQESRVAEMLGAINARRRDAGLRPLKIDPTLTQIAEFYACRLIDGGFFSHDDPFDGSTVDSRASDFSYAFRKIGENLAAGQETPEQAVAEWMESPSHRANLLDPQFVEVGIAVKGGGTFGPCWVVEFGLPLAAPRHHVSPAESAKTEASSPTTRPAKADSPSATTQPAEAKPGSTPPAKRL